MKFITAFLISFLSILSLKGMGPHEDHKANDHLWWRGVKKIGACVPPAAIGYVAGDYWFKRQFERDSHSKLALGVMVVSFGVTAFGFDSAATDIFSAYGWLEKPKDESS